LGDDSLSSLLTIFGLIALRALLALAFGAINNVRPTNLRTKADNGQKIAAQVLALTENNPRLQLTYQITTLLLHFGIAGLALLNLTDALIVAVPVMSRLVAHGLMLLITACVTLILGELVPEAIGSAYANSLATWLIMPVQLLLLIFRPITAGLLMVSKWLSSLFRSGDLVNIVTEEEIMTMLESGHSGGTIEEEEKDMIFSVLQLNETYASEVMIPRIDIKAVEIDTPLEEARAIFVKTGLSRIPVYEDTIDNIKGVLYAKDLLAYWHNGNKEKIKAIRDLLRPAYFVPETKLVDELLKELQSKRVHMAIVVDEYGGTAGIVTIENIIEEIIGDIQDEYDPPEEAEYTQINEHEYVVDAGIDLDDLNDLLSIELPTDDSDTLGGFIFSYFGRVPTIGEEIDYAEEHLMMRVESVEGRRIRKVRIIRQDPKLESDENPVVTDSNSTATGEIQQPESLIRSEQQQGA
jgi:putative hemolysin